MDGKRMTAAYSARPNPAGHPQYISSDLQEQMDQWPEKELLFRFRFDGAYDFAQKLYAGEVLHRRGFDMSFLQEEKRKIVGAMEYEIRKIEKTETFTYKVIHNERQNLIGVIVMAFLTLSLLLLFYKDHPNAREFLLLNVLSAIMGVVITVLMFRRKIRKALEHAADDYKNYKHRLQLIKERWMF
jgi:hypothetical protein